MIDLRWIAVAVMILALPLSTCGAKASPRRTKTRIPYVEAVKGKPATDDNILACSLACGIDWRFSASSSLRSQGGNSYAPELMYDSKVRTAWVEGAKGTGVGQTITVTFVKETVDGKPDTNTYPFDGFLVANGYLKDSDLWKANGRVRRLRVVHKGETRYVVELLDTMNLQEATFPESIKVRSGDEVQFVIEKVYRGSRHSDTAISELLLQGAVH